MMKDSESKIFYLIVTFGQNRLLLLFSRLIPEFPNSRIPEFPNSRIPEFHNSRFFSGTNYLRIRRTTV